MQVSSHTVQRPITLTIHVLSLFIKLSPISCRHCLGRRCIGFINHHLFPSLSVEHDFSAALTSLPCSLQIHMENASAHIRGSSSSSQSISSPSDPHWVCEVLYEALKESRRIVDAIQQSVAFLVGVSTGFIAPMTLIVSILNLPPFFRVCSEYKTDELVDSSTFTYLSLDYFSSTLLGNVSYCYRLDCLSKQERFCHYPLLLHVIICRCCLCFSISL